MAEKSVAIVGAGPAGLIAARKLQALTPFKFTIFEKSERVGGLWDRESFIHPEMMTNFCRFTATFSDFAWENVDLGRPAPVYPQAWMVEKYLKGYGKLIPDECYEFQTCVTRVDREGEMWKVCSTKDGVEKTRYFDFLIVATGYLQHPKELRCEIEPSIKTNPLFPVPILHSTKYRTLEQIVPLDERSHDISRTILVIGGSHSGADIASLIAHQASDARWGPNGNESFGGVKIVHVGMNVLLPIPGMVWDKTATHVSMHPLEFTLCERSTREPEPLTFSFAPASIQENQILLFYYKEIIEGGAGDLDFTEKLPANVALGDRYYQCVQDGRIQLIPGAVTRLDKGKTPATITARVKGKDGTDIAIDDITAVINATGFNSAGSLTFLADDIKARLEFDPTNTRLPAVLNASYMSQNPSIPSLALLGFVPVNWGIIEMQMRAVANRWTARPFAEDAAHVAALGTHMRHIQAALRDPARRDEIPQFLFGDYLGLMEQAARELDMEQIPNTNSAFTGFFCSARFIGPGETKREALTTMHAVQQLREDIERRNPLLAYVAFTGLMGRWTSAAYDVAAHPRRPTAPGFDLEYVVVISGGAGGESTLVARYTEVAYAVTLWATAHRGSLVTGPLICTLPVDRDANGEVATPAGTFVYHVDFRGSRLGGFRVTRRGAGAADETYVFRRPEGRG
ncbi:FAD/NAD(P)-binding domain-containing protein [Karstenula rhodostoma CBS 690.94]|uniref:FAD/NAD(P)-binding domain-containing protein n=1 Tax=Karstenula rhodostoma CBS 690.94 TaxID=1392251 RepID=A0A9P4PGB3_9PLEO|nr:FAD/NAD(P)-binding domain-containing protein [Karstenula rhodostoma CBS 690.94]